MKHDVRPSQLVVVIMLAFAGVGAGHVAEYLLLAPDHHERHELLARTGHHYLPSMLDAGVFVALLGLSLAVLCAFGRGLARSHRGSLRWSRALPAAQVLAFVALEVGERHFAHASLADIAVVLAIGLPLQALVGILAGHLVTVLERVGERLGVHVRGSVPRLRRTQGAAVLPLARVRPLSSLSGAPIPARGPPRILVRC